MVVCVQRLPPEWNGKPACTSRTDRACVASREIPGGVSNNLLADSFRHGGRWGLDENANAR